MKKSQKSIKSPKPKRRPSIKASDIIPDKVLASELEDFVSEKTTKEEPVDTREITRHGGPLSGIASAMADYIGAYNPDSITIDIYNKMKANPQIASGLKIVKLPIVGQNWSVDSYDLDIAEFVYQILRPHWIGLVASALTAVDYGFSAHELVWRVENSLELKRKWEDTPFYTGDAYTISKIKSLYPDTINMNLDDKDNYLGFTQRFIGDNVFVPANKTFVFSHDKGDSFGNIFGISRLKPCYETWYWWVSLMQFMLRYFERKGTPPVIVGFPPGKSKDGLSNADVALSMGKSLLSESVLAMASNTYENNVPKWKVEYLQDDKRGEMFISALTFLEAKMLRGMFVPERVFTQDTTSKAGSYSLSRVHADMFLLGEEALIVELEGQINKYIVRRLVEYNFGRKAPPCFVRIERITDARKGFLKEVFMEMLKSGNAVPAAREIAEMVGVPIEDRPGEPVPPVESEDKTRYISLSEKRDSWWRDAKHYENRKVLSDVEAFLDKRQEEWKTELTDILSKQVSWISDEVSLAMSGKQNLSDIWLQVSTTYDAFGQEIEKKTAWQPLRSKFISALKAMMLESYKFGQSSQIAELGLNMEPKAGDDLIKFLAPRAVAIGDRFLSNLKYGVEMIVLTPSGLSNEAKIKRIQGELFGQLRDVNIDAIVETESMFFLNLGRKKVVENVTG